jgi:2-hydroxychromene-2-carboxylate isomerase
MTAFGHIKNKLQYEQLETARFIRKHNIARFQFNPFFPVNTLAIMRGAVAADAMGMLPRYADAVFHHMWEAPKKMDDPKVIADALAESGLDAAALLAAAQTPEVKQRLADNTERAVTRGTFGAPTFFVGDEIFFGKDRLPDVEAEIRRQSA